MSDNRRIAVETARAFIHIDHRDMLRTAREIEIYLETGYIPDDFKPTEESSLTNNEESHNKDEDKEEVKNAD